MTDQTARLDAGPGYTFEYAVNTEAWWWDASVSADMRATLTVAKATHDARGCEWEFTIVRHDFSDGSHIKVSMFDDVFAAFSEMAPFFAALADRKPTTLDGVRAILDGLGVVDATERVNPNVTADR